MIEGQKAYDETLPNVEGHKFDESKVRVDLIPTTLTYGVGTVLTFGANKYGDRNWEGGINYSRVYGAMLRHIYAWWDGDDRDLESNMHPLWHAACCLAFLIHYEFFSKKYQKFDDRPSYEEDLKCEDTEILQYQPTLPSAHQEGNPITTTSLHNPKPLTTST